MNAAEAYDACFALVDGLYPPPLRHYRFSDLKTYDLEQYVGDNFRIYWLWESSQNSRFNIVWDHHRVVVQQWHGIQSVRGAPADLIEARLRGWL